MKLLTRGNWTVSLDGILVRWFPGAWNLQQRKEREKFQAVLHNILDEVKTETLFVNVIFHQFLTELGCKFYKIVQDSSKDPRKLITYTL
jgi:hypothetical protein